MAKGYHPVNSETRPAVSTTKGCDQIEHDCPKKGPEEEYARTGECFLGCYALKHDSLVKTRFEEVPAL